MGNLVHNISKGRGVEFYRRVKENDPATATLVVMLGSGAITDATLIDLDHFNDITGDAGFTEVVDASYARKTLTDVDLAALPAPDDANDRYEVDLTDLVWTALAGGDSITRLVIGYDELGTGDTQIIALASYDFVVTSDGSDVTAQFNAAGIIRAA